MGRRGGTHRGRCCSSRQRQSKPARCSAMDGRNECARTYTRLRPPLQSSGGLLSRDLVACAARLNGSVRWTFWAAPRYCRLLRLACPRHLTHNGRFSSSHPLAESGRDAHAARLCQCGSRSPSAIGCLDAAALSVHKSGTAPPPPHCRTPHSDTLWLLHNTSVALRIAQQHVPVRRLSAAALTTWHLASNLRRPRSFCFPLLSTIASRHSFSIIVLNTQLLLELLPPAAAPAFLSVRLRHERVTWRAPAAWVGLAPCLSRPATATGQVQQMLRDFAAATS